MVSRGGGDESWPRGRFALWSRERSGVSHSVGRGMWVHGRSSEPGSDIVHKIAAPGARDLNHLALTGSEQPIRISTAGDIARTVLAIVEHISCNLLRDEGDEVPCLGFLGFSDALVDGVVFGDSFGPVLGLAGADHVSEK